MDAFDEPMLAHLGSSWPFFGFCNVEQRENSALVPANLESAGEPGQHAVPVPDEAICVVRQ